MKVHSKNNKFIHYNFPTIDSLNSKILPNTFFLFKCLIPIKLNNIKFNSFKYKNLLCNSILDCGSYCNFISINLVNKLNLKPQKISKNFTIIGISGTTKIDKNIKLKFQFQLNFKNKNFLFTFNEEFLVTDKIPIDLLLGNKFMNKYHIHYDYKNKFIYSDFSLKQLFKKFKNILLLKNSKNFSQKFLNKISNFNNYKFNKIQNLNYYKNLNKNNKFIFNKNKEKSENIFNYNMLIYSFLSNNEEYEDELEEEEEEEEDKLEDIPPQYRDLHEVFSKKKADKLPPHRPVDCKIVLQKDATLHYGPIYPMSEEESEVLKEYIDENLKKGFIRSSESPAGYPVLFQKKKDGSLRLCVDYKKLNEVTIRNSYPIPLITDIIERVKGSNYFTKLDLRSAYNLVRIREGDEYKTAFRTKYGHYEYLVMPFGLKNAPATFQSFINTVFRPFLEKFVILYLDDILIFSKTKEEHHNHVRQVLKKLLENNLFAKLKKCEFDKEKVEFLGYIIDGKGIQTDPKKTEAIREWPTPKCVKDVQRFIGLCNYYRRFVENFANIAKPLHNLTKKNQKFVWSTDCENAFKELKNRLTSTPILLHPDPQKPFIVECDASNYAIGSILSQKDENGKLHPVAYYSRSLNNAEINYSITEKELLAIKSAFSTWRHLLLGAKYKVTVYTDHRNLIYTLGGKIGNQRQHRWHLFFQEYNFQLIYRQGRKNGKPDSLSRRPDYEKNQISEVKEEYILDKDKVEEISCFLSITSDFMDKIIEESKNDEFAIKIYEYFTPFSNKIVKNPYKNMFKFKINNNLIFYNNLIYIPESMRLEILQMYHNKPTAGHLGIKRTEEIITRNYWWPRLHFDVVDYVKTCEICARNKINKHKKYDFLRPLDTPDRPWRSLEIDFLCGLPKSKGYSVIMVVVDRFSKMIHLIPFKEIPNSKQTAKAFLKNIFKLHGLPNEIFTDRGVQFTSSLWTELMKYLKIDSNIATTDHHETIGQVERNNAFIEQYLRIFTNSPAHNDWFDLLPLVEFAYNNAIHESTKETPFFINYGFYPPSDDTYLSNYSNTNNIFIKDLDKNFKIIKDSLLRAKEIFKKQADKKRMEAPKMKVGDLAYVLAPPSFSPENQKLAPIYYGPYEVKNILENNNYKLDISSSPFPKAHPIFHISQLEPFKPLPARFINKNNFKIII